MTKTYACPKCGRDVPLDKINVEAVLKREVSRV